VRAHIRALVVQLATEAAMNASHPAPCLACTAA
jgi:hypothetical protein